MSISQTAITVGTALVEVVAPDIQPVRVTIHNLENTNNRFVYLGGSTLVAGQSIHVDASEILQITLDPGDALYAITSSGSYSLGVMTQKQD
jgi:hypothetical protein